jgi:hypothetical protein
VQGIMTIKFECRNIVTNQEAVDQFVERLATLSFGDWLSVAVSAARTESSRTEANAALDRVITQNGLAFDAWSIGDDVETAFHCSVGATGVTPSPRDCLSLAVAREAATSAALALFVRSLLSASDVESLCLPFASLVPQPVSSDSRRPAAARPPIRLVSGSGRDVRRERPERKSSLPAIQTRP